MPKAPARPRSAPTRRSPAASSTKRPRTATTAAPVAAAPAQATGKPARATAPAAGQESRKLDKPGKVIRDSFTMPRADYAMIGMLKKRCVGLGVALKKSELLRAGLSALQQMPDDRLTAVVSAVHSVKTGRPPGKKKKRAKSEAR